MGRTTILTAGAALLAASLTLSACGGDGGKGDGAAAKSTLDAATSSASPAGPDNSAKPPAELVKAALDGFKNAKSVHMKGEFKDEGKTMRIDFRLGDGQADGSMQGDFGKGPATMKLRTTGGKLYMGADAAFWEDSVGDKTLATMLGSKWVLFPSSQSKEFKSFLSIKQFDKEVFAPLRKAFPGASGGLKTSRADVGGTPAIGITGPDGKATVFVAANGTPHLLRMTSAKAVGEMPEGTFEFSEYDAPLQVEAPADAIDISKIK
ncbi:hypothetical protein AB0L06_16100 [Spirillospora sp. NPDC052269]